MKLLLAFLSGLATIFAFAPYNYSSVLVISLLILLYLLDHTENPFLIGVFYGFGYFLKLYWIATALTITLNLNLYFSYLIIIILLLILSLYIALSCFLFVKLKTGSAVFNSLVLFPSIWVLCEWMRGWLFTGFAWNDIGYSQSMHHLFQGIYPLFGNYAVSWILLSIIGAVYVCVDNMSVVFTYIIIVFSFLLLTMNHAYTHFIKHKPIHIALIRQNIGFEKWLNNIYKTLASYTSIISHIHTDLIITPETSFPYPFLKLPLKDINQLHMSHSTLLLGGVHDYNSHTFNSAILVAKDGHIQYYNKVHLVPYGEYFPFKQFLNFIYKFYNINSGGFIKGTMYQPPLQLRDYSIATNICYENIFNDELIWRARQANLIVNMSEFLWYKGSIAKDQFLQISQVRALENQRYLVSASNYGYSFIIDNQGHVIKKKSNKGVLYATVPLMSGVTPFEHYGNLFIASICVLWLSLTLLI